MLLGTHTSGAETNHLMIATVQIPRLDAPNNPPKLDQDRLGVFCVCVCVMCDVCVLCVDVCVCVYYVHMFVCVCVYYACMCVCVRVRTGACLGVDGCVGCVYVCAGVRGEGVCPRS